MRFIVVNPLAKLLSVAKLDVDDLCVINKYYKHFNIDLLIEDMIWLMGRIQTDNKYLSLLCLVNLVPNINQQIVKEIIINYKQRISEEING